MKEYKIKLRNCCGRKIQRLMNPAMNPAMNLHHNSLLINPKNTVAQATNETVAQATNETVAQATNEEANEKPKYDEVRIQTSGGPRYPIACYDVAVPPLPPATCRVQNVCEYKVPNYCFQKCCANYKTLVYYDWRGTGRFDVDTATYYNYAHKFINPTQIEPWPEIVGYSCNGLPNSWGVPQYLNWSGDRTAYNSFEYVEIRNDLVYKDGFSCIYNGNGPGNVIFVLTCHAAFYPIGQPSGTIKLIIYAGVPVDYNNFNDIDTTPPGARKMVFNDFYINSSSTCYDAFHPGLYRSDNYFYLGIPMLPWFYWPEAPNHTGAVQILRSISSLPPGTPSPAPLGPFYL